MEIGTNTVQITAKGTYAGDVKKKVIINRNNKTITYSENVKIAEEKDYEQLGDEIAACWVDTNETKDTGDDTMVLLVREDSLLLKQIKDGLLQKGDVYMIPQNETLVTGFTAVYERHQPPCGTEDYSVEDYPDDAFEEIIFSYPSYADIFSENVSLDLSGEIDEENPIAFATLPDGTPLDIKAETSEKKTSGTGRNLPSNKSNWHQAPFSDHYNFYQAENENYPNVGWQPQELLKNIKPSLSEVYNIDEKNLNVTLNWEDIVLYDADGKKSTENDQLKLCGKLGIENIKHEGLFEWHLDEFQLMPRQIMQKLTYDFTGTLELKGDVSVKGALTGKENSKHHFENKNKVFLGLEVSGVTTLDDKWMIGSIGININTHKPVWGVGLNEAQKESEISPVVVLYLFLDINGNLTIEGSLSYTHKTTCTKGFNLQKDGFIGKYGSQEDNRGEKHGEIPIVGYTWDIYDKNETEQSVNLGGKIGASVDFGMGAGVGVMLFGICPATVCGEVFLRLKGEAEEGIQLTWPSAPDSTSNPMSSFVPDAMLKSVPDSAMTAEASAYCGFGVKVDAVIRLAASESKLFPSIEKRIEPWEHFFWEKELLPSISVYNGHAYRLYDKDKGCTWEEAKKYCEEKGGYLVTITSDDEQKVIENLLNDKGGKNSYWLGAYKDSAGDWTWITGEPFDYKNWAPKQPDSYKPYGADGEEDVLMMYREENPNNPSLPGKWNDIRRDGTCGTEEFFGAKNFGFICEWNNIPFEKYNTIY